jgi:hypothetical protein
MAAYIPHRRGLEEPQWVLISSQMRVVGTSMAADIPHRRGLEELRRVLISLTDEGWK